MELIRAHDIGQASSNFTNAELLIHAEREFRNPSGTLKLLLERFLMYVETYEDPETMGGEEYEIHPCPTCGSPIKIILDDCK